jgi:hypothetical protein
MPTASQGRRAPTCYELRVLGHLDPHWSTWFTGLTLTQEDDGTSALRGMVTDQAELHGLLAKVRDLGATLLSVTSADTTREREPIAGTSTALDAEPDTGSQEQQHQ